RSPRSRQGSISGPPPKVWVRDPQRGSLAAITTKGYSIGGVAASSRTGLPQSYEPQECCPGVHLIERVPLVVQQEQHLLWDRMMLPQCLRAAKPAQVISSRWGTDL